LRIQRDLAPISPALLVANEIKIASGKEFNMHSLRKMILAALILAPLSVGLAVPASAATGPATTTVTASHIAAVSTPQAPFPSCGDHFTLFRSGSTVRIVGVDLKAFSNGYMLVWVAANGKSFGPYNASPSGGANFQINTGSSAQTTIAISLTNSANTVTLCAQDYYA
jgi:hypothetical protein